MGENLNLKKAYDNRLNGMAKILYVNREKIYYVNDNCIGLYTKDGEFLNSSSEFMCVNRYYGETSTDIGGCTFEQAVEKLIALCVREETSILLGCYEARIDVLNDEFLELDSPEFKINMALCLFKCVRNYLEKDKTKESRICFLVEQMIKYISTIDRVYSYFLYSKFLNRELKTNYVFEDRKVVRKKRFTNFHNLKEGIPHESGKRGSVIASGVDSVYGIDGEFDEYETCKQIASAYQSKM